MTKILIAEDEPMTLKLIEFKLKRHFPVVTAQDGESALRLAEAENPALIILDAGMPKLDGLEVLRQLKEHPRLQDVPVIMLTGRNKDEDMEKALQLGASEYLTKPFNPAELMSKVRRFVREPVA